MGRWVVRCERCNARNRLEREPAPNEKVDLICTGDGTTAGCELHLRVTIPPPELPGVRVPIGFRSLVR
jgi:hypothetical protein